MTLSFYPHEEMTFREFVLFNKTYLKQMEENMSIYLNLEPTILESDRKRTEMLLQSFFHLLTHSKVEDVDEDYTSSLDIWVQSQLSTLNQQSFNLFQLIYQKALITQLIQIKHNRMTTILMFLLTIYTYLIHSYTNWMNEDTSGDIERNLHENRQLQRLQSLEKLDKVLIRSSGVRDLAYILKKCEVYFNYKRCVFYAYVPWLNQFYGVMGVELLKIQSMKGQVTEEHKALSYKKPLYLKDPKDYVKEEHIKLFNLSSIIFIPITHQNQLFGWLTFDQIGEEFDCSKGELELLEQVGKRLGLFLSREGEGVVKTSEIHLTERESVVLSLLAEGYDNKRIGELLFLSEHTVRDYVSSLMTKLKAKNRTQVVASAFRTGLLN